MNQALSTDQQIARIGRAFAEGGDSGLADALRQLPMLEATLWLLEYDTAAVFCVELQRLGAHARASAKTETLALFESGLQSLAKVGDPDFASVMGGLVTEMRAVRGAAGLIEAGTLTDLEPAIWREMHRRGNPTKKFRRHVATLIDLIDAMRDPEKCEAALKLLGREAGALCAMFRLNPSSLLWGSLVELARGAQGQIESLTLVELDRYCRSLGGSPAEAKTLVDARPAVVEVVEMSVNVAGLEQAQPLASLLAAKPEDLAPKARKPTQALAEQAEPLPIEIVSISEALSNLQAQIAAGVLEATPVSEQLASLARTVLDSDAGADERRAHYSRDFMQLAELVDLVASGVAPSEAEVSALTSRLEDYASVPEAVEQVDEALQTLQRLRAQLVSGTASGAKVDLELDTLASLTERLGGEARDTGDTGEASRRVFGYVLTRGDLGYAMRHVDGMRIERVSAKTTAVAVDALFPQTAPLAPPTEVLTFDYEGQRLGLASDRVQGPLWIELESPMRSDQGFAMRIQGDGLCFISPALAQSACS